MCEQINDYLFQGGNVNGHGRVKIVRNSEIEMKILIM